TVFPRPTILACWGAPIVGAIYMLRAVRTLLHGPLPDQWARVADAQNLWRKAPYLVLLASLMIFGFFPRLLTDKMQPEFHAIVTITKKANSNKPAQAFLVQVPADPGRK